MNIALPVTIGAWYGHIVGALLLVGLLHFHHIFQSDYRNGVRWYQWDSTKWMIRCCAWLGLARNLNRVAGFKIQRALLSMQPMQLTRASNQLETSTAADHLRE